MSWTGWTQIPDGFIDDYMHALSSEAVKVYLAIRRNGGDATYMAIKSMTGIGSKHQIERAEAELREAGLI